MRKVSQIVAPIELIVIRALERSGQRCKLDRKQQRTSENRQTHEGQSKQEDPLADLSLRDQINGSPQDQRTRDGRGDHEERQHQYRIQKAVHRCKPTLGIKKNGDHDRGVDEGARSIEEGVFEKLLGKHKGR